MLKENLFYSTVIEHDNGRISKEPTLLGIILIAVGLAAAFALIIILAL